MSDAYVTIMDKMQSMQDEIEALTIVVAVLYVITTCLVCTLICDKVIRRRRPMEDVSMTDNEMHPVIIEMTEK